MILSFVDTAEYENYDDLLAQANYRKLINAVSNCDLTAVQLYASSVKTKFSNVLDADDTPLLIAIKNEDEVIVN